MNSIKHRQRIGVVSIAPSIENPASSPFPILYEAIGKNTGNLMFTVSMYRQLAGDIRQIGFAFDADQVNETCDAVVVPAANWLNNNSNWDWLCDRIERLEVPVVTIGLGLQADSLDFSTVRVSESSIRLARLLSRKGSFISTRGNFTTKYLNSIGVMNVVTTGCPSIYLRQGLKEDGQGDGLVIQSTRYEFSAASAGKHSINQELFRLAAASDADMIFQSEPEEIEYLVYGAQSVLLSKPRAAALPRTYGFQNLEEFLNYINGHGKVFFDIDRWSKFITSKEFLVGTRLHGVILALNCDVPAVLFAHDSRTAEMIEFARLPTANLPTGLEKLDRRRLRQMVDEDAQEIFYATRRSNGRVYREFLRANGLAYNEGMMH